MAVSKQQKLDLVVKFGGSEQNTGKTEVQIAILSAEIASLTSHMIENKKDKTSKRGLYKKVAQRKKLLSYLMRTDIERYREIVKELNLRG
ncbi:30S ribosomal protein S15 [Ureaplasma diversum]|uniref:Small ribosomal subunit protein uS15 n=2 Tax=Ureaplasma diversum TaxID=42094 RepID=A0A084EXP5_9BACT|nr:30S ribosomal protein S15 [Ureaplasma diversum]AJQ45489.1 30S ribosomal protein S15 [Ureaplasma diversum]KEZ22737.1 30S ribosomal protein S15 [Ureaplasma diversum NCTC 246]